jgi:hypothetical protein
VAQAEFRSFTSIEVSTIELEAWVTLSKALLSVSLSTRGIDGASGIGLCG